MVKAWFLAAQKNWHTTLWGALIFLGSVPGFYDALRLWAEHKPVNWREVGLSIFMAMVAAGFGSTKDATVHSTPAEVSQAGKDAAKAA